ncbi:putative serpin-Z8 [Triticum aestivum]|uniref:putative serpin-Z8 n=1 Tax=Triticum aestivum TaxID=4565 RepID=UPI001D00B619|nr:putative serpin-Z8 [Triticum aestivum]
MAMRLPLPVSLCPLATSGHGHSSMHARALLRPPLLMLPWRRSSPPAWPTLPLASPGAAVRVLGARSRSELEDSVAHLLDGPLRDRSSEPDGGGPSVAFACGVWSDLTLPLKAAFRDAVVGRYNAEARSVDFRNDPEQAVQQIDAWAAAATGNLIQSAVPPGASMCIFLPDARDGLASLLDKITSASPAGFLREHLPKRTVSVGEFWVPKFELSFQSNLTGVFNDLGLRLPFTQDADLSEMLQEQDGRLPEGRHPVEEASHAVLFAGHVVDPGNGAAAAIPSPAPFQERATTKREPENEAMNEHTGYAPVYYVPKPVSPVCDPVSPVYSPTSPVYHPYWPAYSPCSPVYSPVPPEFQPVLTPESPTYRYSPVAYSPQSPAYKHHRQSARTSPHAVQRKPRRGKRKCPRRKQSK